MSDSTEQPKLLTTAELAALLRTTESGIRSKLYRGQIPAAAILRAPASKPGGTPRGKLLFRRSVIEKHFSLGAGS